MQLKYHQEALSLQFILTLGAENDSSAAQKKKLLDPVRFPCVIVIIGTIIASIVLKILNTGSSFIRNIAQYSLFLFYKTDEL